MPKNFDERVELGTLRTPIKLLEGDKRLDCVERLALSTEDNGVKMALVSLATYVPQVGPTPMDKAALMSHDLFHSVVDLLIRSPGCGQAGGCTSARGNRTAVEYLAEGLAGVNYLTHFLESQTRAAARARGPEWKTAAAELVAARNDMAAVGAQQEFLVGRGVALIEIERSTSGMSPGAKRQMKQDIGRIQELMRSLRGHLSEGFRQVVAAPTSDAQGVTCAVGGNKRVSGVKPALLSVSNPATTGGRAIVARKCVQVTPPPSLKPRP